VKSGEANCSAQRASLTRIDLSVGDSPLASGGREGRVEWINSSLQVEIETAAGQMDLGMLAEFE
jgi:hypothetical protein